MNVEGAEQKVVAPKPVEKPKNPSYKDILDAVKQKQAAEREVKERQLQRKPAANPEEYIVKHVLDSVPSGDVKITPSQGEQITFSTPQENITMQERPTISFPALSEKPLSIDGLVSAFRSGGDWLDGSQVVTLKNCAIDIQNAIIVEVQDGKKGNWEYLYNKAIELEAIAQEQINGRLPMPAEKTDTLHQTGVTLSEIQSKKIVPHMVRDRSELLRKSLENIPAYQHASLDAREDAQKLADNMEKELNQATPENFISQILQQEANFLSGDHVSFASSESDSVLVSVDASGKVSVSLPREMHMTHVIQLAGEFSRIFPGQTTGDTRIGQFAQHLEDTALLMAQHGGFSSDTLETVFNTGQKLHSLLSPDNAELSSPKTAFEISEKAESTAFTQEERQKLITEMLLGRGSLTRGADGQLQKSPFERLYSRWEQYHPGESEETFIKEYLEPKNYRLDFLKPYIEVSTKKGGKAHDAMQEVAQQRAHESITQTQVDSWIEAVRGASGMHDVEFTQTIHAALADARAELERANKMRAVLGEPLVTVEEAKIREIEAITTLMQSPDIADKLTYAPADIRTLLSMAEPPLGEEALWDAACNIKAAYAKAAFEKLGFAVGMKRDGTHRYLLIKVGAKGEERVIEVDVTTPKKMEINGEMMFLSGIQEITDEADIQNALLDISQDDSNQILISSIYNNVAMQIRKNGGDPQVVESFLTMAMQADQKNDAAAYGLFILTGDLSMQRRALMLNPNIAEEWEAEKGFIGAWAPADFDRNLVAITIPPIPTPAPGTALSSKDLYYTELKNLQVNIIALGELSDNDLKNALVLIAKAHMADSTGFTPADIDVIDELKAEWTRRQERLRASHARMSVEHMKAESQINRFRADRNQLEADKASGAKTVAQIQAEELRLRGEEITLVGLVNTALDKAPDMAAQDFPHYLLEWASEFGETRERVVNSIMFNPYRDKAELNTYRISFYAEPRLKDMINAFKTHGDMEKYDYYVSMQNAIEVSHGMNKLVNVGEIGALSKVAQEMNKEHFALMSQVPSQGVVMELYEKEYTRIIARDKRVSPNGYDEIKLNVQAQLKTLNESGIVRSEFENQRGGDHIMKDWEILRAYSAGRAMYNMFLRSSMHISFSQITEGVDYGTSYPQGRIVESLNPWDTLFERWTMGEEWGGPEFVKQDTTEWYRAMKDYHYIQGINRIYTLGNKSIDSIQKAAQLKFVDFLSGFRINNIAFPVIYMEDPNNPTDPNKRMSLKKYLDDNVYKGINIDQLQKDANNQAKSKTERDAARKTLNDALFNIVDNTDLGLGALLMHGSFLNTGKEKSSIDTYDARVHLWEKVANYNLPLMTDYLTGLKFVNRDENGVVIEDIDSATGKQRAIDIWVTPTGKQLKLDKGTYVDPDTGKRFDLVNGGLVDSLTGIPATNVTKILSLEQIIAEKWSGCTWEDINDPKSTSGNAQKWKKLTDKMQHNRFVYERDAMLKNPNSKVSKSTGQRVAKRDYLPEEQPIIDAIQENGRKLAPHLADVYWNNIPFLDIPMEEVDYKQLGSDEYRRKVAGDHSQLYTAFSSLIAIAKKPASQDTKTFTENMKAIIDNIEDVDGGIVAQQNTYPITKIVMEWKMIDKGSRFFMYHNLKNMINQPNSQAQRLQGIHAEALDEFATNDEIDDLMKAGVLTPQFAKKLKKQLGTSLWKLIWSIMRDAGYMMPYIIAEPFLGESLKFE